MYAYMGIYVQYIQIYIYSIINTYRKVHTMINVILYVIYILHIVLDRPFTYISTHSRIPFSVTTSMIKINK